MLQKNVYKKNKNFLKNSTKNKASLQEEKILQSAKKSATPFIPRWWRKIQGEDWHCREGDNKDWEYEDWRTRVYGDRNPLHGPIKWLKEKV